MQKALYVEYADLEAQRDQIEERQKVLKVAIFQEIKALGPDKNGVESDFGSFTLQKKPVYGFSKVITDMEENLKNRKAQEVQMGVAKIKSTTEYVVFRPVKSVI